MQMNKQPDKNSLGYKVGLALSAVFFGCGAAIMVALTIKLILWMF